MKIFITGCAKSGTTLLARLFNAFDCQVVNEEISLEGLIGIEHNGILVGKRSEYSIFSQILNRKDFVKQKNLLDKVIVINVVRNGGDVFESFEASWGVWNPMIWCTAINEARVNDNLIDITVKYEDLIATPDVVQEMIAETLGLKILCDFTYYPLFVPEHCFKSNNERYLLQEIHNARIGKPFKLKRGIDIDYFNELMEYCGYDKHTS